MAARKREGGAQLTKRRGAGRLICPEPIFTPQSVLLPRIGKKGKYNGEKFMVSRLLLLV